MPWPVWLCWLEHHPVTKMLQVRFLVRAHAWVAGLIPGPGAKVHNPQSGHVIAGSGMYGMQPVCASLLRLCLSLCLSLFPPLSKVNEKRSLGEDKK